MRYLVALLLAAGCFQPTTGEPPPPIDPPVPPSAPPDAWSVPVDGGPGPGGAFCEQDSECASGTVCARDWTCRPPDQLYTGHAEWTLMGQPASATSCASSTSLVVGFSDGSGYGTGGYAPVPCAEGEFTLTKLPRTFTTVDIAIDAGSGAAQDPVTGAVDPQTGVGLVDLPY